MTHQEIYDQVAKHLLTQKRASRAMVNGRFLCMYRGDNGDRCAIGCLISDESYSPKMEQAGFLEPELFGALESAGVELYGLTIQLLDKLRDTHDNWPPNQWKERLERVAYQYGLNSKVLEQF